MPAGGLDAVHDRHADVHQHHVGPRARGRAARPRRRRRPSPTTVKSGWVASSAANPARTTSWSSATTTRSHALRPRRGRTGLDQEAPPAPAPVLSRRRPSRPAPACRRSPCPPRRSRPGPGPLSRTRSAQRVGAVAQLHVDRRAGRVPAGVGQRLLHDAVRRQLDARVERRDRAAHDEPRAGAPAARALVEQLVELVEAGLRRRSGPRRRPRAARRAAAASRSARRGRCRRSPASRSPPCGRQARRGQPGGLGLHGDHGDVVGHDVVQLARDAGPLAAGRCSARSARSTSPASRRALPHAERAERRAAIRITWRASARRGEHQQHQRRPERQRHPAAVAPATTVEHPGLGDDHRRRHRRSSHRSRARERGTW